MITFLEGLPRAGKSYSCVKDEIVPALANHRPVVAYVEGLNYPMLAELAGITLDECNALLISLTREQVKGIVRKGAVPQDSLIVIDEVQNFWPGGRGSKVDEATTLFVSEHGHDGLDIVLMGQAFNDVHQIWRNRVERKVFFLKKSAIGKPDSYRATFFSKTGQTDKGPVFVDIQSVDYDYDPKYFGAYKSHTDGTKNKATKIEERAVIWNSPFFKKWIWIFGVLFFLAIYYVWHLFHGGLEQSITKKPVESAQAATPLKNLTTKTSLPDGAPDRVRFGVTDGVVPTEQPDMIQELSVKHRIRFVGTWRIGSGSQNGRIEWRAQGGELIQTFTFRDLEGLGYTVFANTGATLAVLVKGDTRLIAPSWSVDKREGQASETQQRSVSGKSPLVYPENGYRKLEPPVEGVDLARSAAS